MRKIFKHIKHGLIYQLITGLYAPHRVSPLYLENKQIVKEISQLTKEGSDAEAVSSRKDRERDGEKPESD